MFTEPIYYKNKDIPYFDIVRSTDAVTEPVTLQEVKTQARVSGSAFDTELTSLITAARGIVEDYTRRSLITQTWDLYLNDWPNGQQTITLPYGRLIAVTDILYSVDGQQDTTVNASTYNISEGDVGVIKPVDSWPTTDTDFPRSVRIRYTAGFGTNPSDVPQQIKQAILVLCVDLFDAGRSSFQRGQANHVSLGSPFSPSGEKFLWQLLLDKYKIHYF